jgi:hypothetical protein
MDVLSAALGRQGDPGPYFEQHPCVSVLDMMSGGDFDQLAKVVLMFCNEVAIRSEARLTNGVVT